MDSATGFVGIGKSSPKTRLDVDGAVRVKSYSVAALPSAIDSGAGAMVYATNAAGGGIIVFSDGSDWRSVADRTVI